MQRSGRTLAFVMMIVLACVRSAAARDIDCSYSGDPNVYYEEIQCELVDGEYQIILRGRGHPGMTITVTAINGSNPIRFIRINTLESVFSRQGNVSLVVRETNGTIPYIRQIQYYDDITPVGFEPGELWISTIEISGGLGDPGTSHSGFVVADIVGTLDVAGAITADIISGPRLFGGTSSIALIQSRASNILGDIFAPEGAINEVSAGEDEGGAFTGTIGDSDNTVNIFAKYSIQKVLADSIYANIDATVYAANEAAWSDVWYVKTEVGPFTGYLKAKSIYATPPSGLNIAGDFVADVTLSSLLREPLIVGGDVPTGRTISVGGVYDIDDSDGRILISGAMAGKINIGGSLSGDATVASLGGLTGQIIVNSNNGTGTWNNLVTVGGPPSPEIVLGPSELSPRTAPYYDLSGSYIGGGAVGLAPFTFHEDDSSPADDSTVAPGLTHADMLMYGPVTITGGGTASPVTVERRHLSSGSPWIDVSINYTATVMNPPSRVVRITPNTGTFQKGYEYRIIPVQTTDARRLVCDISAASQPVPQIGRPLDDPDPDPSIFDRYTFTIAPFMGMMDRSGDGTLDEADLAEWLADPFDLDDDGKATEEDFALLEYFVKNSAQ